MTRLPTWFHINGSLPINYFNAATAAGTVACDMLDILPHYARYMPDVVPLLAL
jgi:hypothetical protein